MATSFVAPASAQAYICSPQFTSPITAGTSSQVTFDLSNATNPVSCLNNPSRQRCYVIRGCNTGVSGTYGCLSYSNFDLPNQALNGTDLTAGETRNGDLTFWLEDWDPSRSVGTQAQRSCGSTEWKIQIGRADCGDGTFAVVGVRNGVEINNYTFEDQLRIKFDGSKTSNFLERGFFSGFIEQNGTPVNWFSSGPSPLGGNFSSPLGGGNRLHYNFGGLRTNIDIGQLPASQQTYQIVIADANLGRERYCSFNFRVSEDGNNDVSQAGVVNFEICNQIPITDPGRPLCEACLEQTPRGIWTGIGCIKSTPTEIIGTVVKIGLGLAGGVALLMILAASALFTTSKGNPKQTEQAKELVTSAVIGLLFIIFSVMILQFIGISILRLPEFGV